jgi:hypothetical protein
VTGAVDAVRDFLDYDPPGPRTIVHRIGEVDHVRRLAARALTTARYWSEEGDRRAAALALSGAAALRRRLVDAKEAHVWCCPDTTFPRPVRLPGMAQLTAIPGRVQRGRWLP